MSETLNHGNRRDSFETEDLSPQGVFYFMAGLAVLGIVIYFILVGMYRILDARDRNREAPSNPMAIKTGVDPQTMNFKDITDKIDQTFPKPVLEYNERTQFTQEIVKEDEILASYGWVDQESGVARIPIERAMELVAERGLPVLPQGAKNQTSPAATEGPAEKAGPKAAPKAEKANRKPASAP